MSMLQLMHSVVRVAQGQGLKPRQIRVPRWMYDQLCETVFQFAKQDDCLMFRGAVVLLDDTIDEPIANDNEQL